MEGEQILQGQPSGKQVCAAIGFPINSCIALSNGFTAAKKQSTEKFSLPNSALQPYTPKGDTFTPTAAAPWRLTFHSRLP